MKTLKSIAVALAILLGFVQIGSAGAFNPISGVGAEFKGKGGAGIASGAPGLFNNPAGISEKRFAEIGGDLIFSQLSYESKEGKEYDSKFSFGAVPLAGINEDFGNLNVYYGTNTPFVFESDFKDDLNCYSQIALTNFGTAISYDFDPLVIGAAVKAGYGRLKLESPQFMNNVNIGVLEIEATGWGLSYQLGVVYRVDPVFSFGATYQSPTKVEMGGDAYLDSPLLGKVSDGLEADFYFPGYYGIGFCYQFGKTKFSFDYMKYDYSKLNTVGIDFEKKLPDSDMMLNFRSNEYWGLGADYLLNEKWTIRSGITYQSLVIPDQSASPATPDTDAIGVSSGFTVNFKNYSIDGALVFVQGLERKAGEESQYPGDYNGRVGLASIGIKWYFD